MPNFSSKEYSWSNVSVNILGRTIRGLLAVDYTDKQEKTYLYGRGSDPLSIQSGNKSYEGELTLTQSEVEAMELAAKSQDPANSLSDVSFDIVVSYGQGNLVHTDIIVSAEIKEQKKGMKQGDKNMDIKLPFIALGIKKGV